MRVVAYSIKSTEKEPLAIANHKKHEITLISNPLSAETVSFAAGKEAVIVFKDDDVSAGVITELAALGVKFIASRATDGNNIDLNAAGLNHIKIANVPYASTTGVSDAQLPMVLAVETINNLDKWEGKKCLGDACICSRSCDQNGRNNTPVSKF